MGRIVRSRPSPALIIAVLALVAGVTGAAIARPQAAKPVTKSKVKRIANKQIDKRFPLVENSQTFPVPSGGAAAQTVSCGPGETVVGGGGKFKDAPVLAGIFMQVDHRDGNGWRSGGANGDVAAHDFTTYAYCIPTD